MRITTGSPPPRDGQIPILSTSIQPSPAAHADLPHQSAGSDSFRKDFLPLLILLLLKTPENEGMLKVPVSFTLRAGSQCTSYRGVWIMPAQPCDRNYFLSGLSASEFELLRLHLTSC